MPEVVYQIFVSSWGGLEGVRRHLDHIVELGADTVYLTPIFRAPSDHKYDTADYEIVDESFGGMAAFEQLVADTRARKLGLILDGVFNHVGSEHAWAREKRFLRGSDWRGYPTLPELDLANGELREMLFGKSGVIARWTARGVTGWRLDCANDLGPEICALAKRAAQNAADGVIGELMSYPTDRSGVDGVMNYWLRSCALQLHPAAQTQEALDRLAREIDPGFLQRSWNLTASHDTPRLATLLDGDRVRQATALQFAYPGVPMIYYGEEIGMRGGADPLNRAPMIWDTQKWDHAHLDWMKRLIRLRREKPALREGRYVPLPQPGTDVVAFARVTNRPLDTLIFVANASGEPRHVRLFVPLPWMFDAVPLDDLLGGSGAKMEAGCLHLTLPPHGSALLSPRDDHPSGYRFWK
jgi:glycosidase